MRLNKTDKMILVKLREGRCSPRYLSKELEKSQPYINQRLKKLKNLNYVVKIDRGLYAHSKRPTKTLDAEKMHEELTNEEILYLTDEMRKNQSPNDNKTQSISQKITEYVKMVIRNEIPRSNTAQKVMFDAVLTLDKKGKLSRNELEQELYSKYPDAYETSESLWESTMGRIYKEVPGVTRTNDGLYGFDEDEIDMNEEQSLDQWSK